MAKHSENNKMTAEDIKKTFQVREGDVAPNYKVPSRTFSSSPTFSTDLLILLYNDALYDGKISNEETLEEFSPKYDLSKMCKTANIEDGLSDERFLLNWMKNNFDRFKRYESQDEFHRVEIFTSLATFLSSNIIKPDISLFSELIPLFLGEVHSTMYESCILKCVISLVYQLRALRHFDVTINYVHGFVFPKRNTKQCVTKVKVEWKDLKFYAQSWFLEVDKVFDEIDGVLKEQCEFALLGKVNFSFFMPLSQSDLTILTQELNCKSPLQLAESKYSILVKDEEFYYKIVTFNKNSDTLNKLEKKRTGAKTKDISRLCLPIDIQEVFGLFFFKFELQPHQFLSMNEARKCLKDFIKQALAAVKQLHNLNFAHNDIRLPNFVFSKDYELRLIDFDRSRYVNLSPLDSKNYFNVPPKLASSAKSLDYKQIGLLILQILNQEVAKNNWEKICQSKPEDFHHFLRGMIFYGDYDESVFLEFLSDQNDDNCSLVDVLTERTEREILSISL